MGYASRKRERVGQCVAFGCGNRSLWEPVIRALTIQAANFGMQCATQEGQRQNGQYQSATKTLCGEDV